MEGLENIFLIKLLNVLTNLYNNNAHTRFACLFGISKPTIALSNVGVATSITLPETAVMPI
jgi:type II restriction/modification system DNA methylase subunit YeeA